MKNAQRLASKILIVILVAASIEFPIPNTAHAATVIFITSGTSWTVPSDWNSANNTIEVIGGGGGGATGAFGGGKFHGGGGGGGGAYSKISNLTLTPNGSVTIQVGAGGASDTAGTATWFNGSTCTGASICGYFGNTGVSQGAGGAGGSTASSVGTTKFAGGSGGAASTGNNTTAGGGGGAAGPSGAGNTGASQPTSTGGSGDAGAGGAGGAAGTNPGGNGTEWDATHGSGGGGGGGNAKNVTGGAGGTYGAGGGGGDGAIAGGAGYQGIIVVTYVSTATAPTVTTNSATGVNFNSANLVGSITATGGINPTTEGFAYGTNSTLATAATTTTSGSFGTGVFNSSISGLSANTTYYYRAYATNTSGTGYGSILNFTTGNSSPTRKMRLFEGFQIKLISGRMILEQN